MNSQQRIDSQPLFNSVHSAQELVLKMATNFADTKHNKFETGLNWTEVSQDLIQSMTTLLEVENRLENSGKTMVDMEKEVRRMLNSDEKLTDMSQLTDLYDQKLAENSAQSEANFEDNVRYKKLTQLLDEFVEEEADDDLMTISNDEERIPIDPFSKTEIRNPVKNKTCGHVYDGDQLRKVLEGRGANQRQRCPIVGCSNRAVTLEDCAVDHKTKALIQRLRNDPKIDHL